MPNLLSATFNVAVYTDEIMENGRNCDLFSADTEEQAIEKAYSFETAYAYKTKLVQHVETIDETEPKNMFMQLSDGTYLRIGEESSYRYINFEETYSLSEICDKAEKGELSMNPLSIARMRGQLNAYRFLAEVGVNASDIEEPRFIIARKAIKGNQGNKRVEDFRLLPVQLQKGEIVYNKKRHQIWPAIK